MHPSSTPVANASRLRLGHDGHVVGRPDPGRLGGAGRQAGSWPKLDAAPLMGPIACLLIVMAVASLLAGITGDQLAKASGFELPAPFGPRIPRVVTTCSSPTRWHIWPLMEWHSWAG